MEILDVFDENEKLIGTADRKKVHKEGLWHLQVGAWLMNQNGEILLELRSKNKKANPNKWSRIGGHVDSGETPIVSIQREVLEEVGINIPIENYELISKIKDESYNEQIKSYNRRFLYSYFAYTNTKIEDCILQKEEVDDIKYVTIEEIVNFYNTKDENYVFGKWNKDFIDESINFLTQKRKELNKK